MTATASLFNRKGSAAASPSGFPGRWASRYGYETADAVSNLVAVEHIRQKVAQM